MFLGWRVCRRKVSLMKGCAFVKAFCFFAWSLHAHCSFWFPFRVCGSLQLFKIPKAHMKRFSCHGLLFWPSYAAGEILFYFRHVMLCMDFIVCLASQHFSLVFLPLCFCRTSHWMASDQSEIEGCGQSSAAFRQRLSMQWKLLPLQLLDTPTTDVIIAMSSRSSFVFLIYFSLWGTLMKFGKVFAHIQQAFNSCKGNVFLISEEIFSCKYFEL